MTEHLEAARDRLGGLHDHLSRREVALAADDLDAILSAILDHLEEQQTDASIKHGLADAAAGRTEQLGRFTDDEPEPEPDYGPRPAGCCGTCPPVLGGGYDCTCVDNPRCDANRADRYDLLGDRWVWCDGCDGFRRVGYHSLCRPGAGWFAVGIDKDYGPLTFAPRPAEPEPEPDNGPRPAGCCGTCPPILGGGYDCTCADNPDPLDESNHTDRYDRDGDRWVWCDGCDGFMDIHGMHKPGWTAAEIDEGYGPLTFAPRPADTPTAAQQPDEAHGDADESTKPKLNVQPESWTAIYGGWLDNIRAEAWEEGWRTGYADGAHYDDPRITPNPYRKDRA